MNIDLRNAAVLVVGAGIMGAGIVQVAALAGHRVQLFDLGEGAAVRARDKLAASLAMLVDKGRLGAEAAHAAIARIEPIATLDAAAGCSLVVEAIVEQLEAKRGLFRQLEGIVGAQCVLASNTSSISITAIASGLQQPERLVGMHFFNPVPLMKLVEVVSGLRTAPGVAEAIVDLSKAWGKVPVHAKSTPGFIVNRVARPYYAETLALLHEQAATPAVLDACLKGAGFRMGPCELMDLIGHDTNFAVTNSVFEANFQDKRYVPSLLQREMVAGGLLGRKSGQGFFTYPAGAAALPVPAFGPPPMAHEVTVHGSGPIAEQLVSGAMLALEPQGWGPERDPGSDWVGLQVDGARLMLTQGAPASVVARQIDSPELALFDRPVVLPNQTHTAPGTALAFCVHPQASSAWQAAAPAWLQALGFAPQRLSDTPGLVVARTLAMLINEAADAVLQGVCDPAGADAAMKLGLNYPAGPFEWLAAWNVPGVMRVLQALDAEYRGERYRLSPWLRRQPH
jgi:3-hydroxybutyryl-CoA dehydrogenase